MLIALGFIILSLAGGYLTGRFYLIDPSDPSNTNIIIFDAKPDQSFREIAQSLEAQGLIQSRLAFRLLARIDNKDTAIKAGEYELSAAMSPTEILNKMIRGDVRQRRVTIKEGATISDIATALESAGIANALAFESAARDHELMRDLGTEAPTLEGYLFPETYQFHRDTPPRQIIKAMLEQLTKKWPEEWNARARLLELSRHQILTLASIIEKESGNFEEQPIISSVFHNRLRIKMRLQSDPTVIYGITNFNGNITKRDLQTHTPYNTYMIDGLPPGPIASPGFSAIKSALYPADTNFYYFVGNGAGKHIFSEDLARHNQAVNTFQRGGGAGINAADSDSSHADALAPIANTN